MKTIDRRAYAEMFGPTTGDRVRLADTDLVIEVERDFTVYGEEVKFGGGKVIRDGMGQSQRLSAEVADTITPVLSYMLGVEGLDHRDFEPEQLGRQIALAARTLVDRRLQEVSLHFTECRNPAYIAPEN